MRNTTLEGAMRQRGLTQAELAELVNDQIESLTGKRGLVTDRTVRQWVSGKIRWPHAVRRIALEAVLECGITDLGFVPRGGSHQAPKEGPVHRRNFISAASGTLLATTGAPRRIGSSDIERLQATFAALVASGQRQGGSTVIEARAARLANEALDLLTSGTASQRIRESIYACAASFTTSAMWAALDGRRFEAAQRHFDRAVALAAMSGDSATQFHVWSYAGALYRHLGRPHDAMAANDVARRLPITRRDPMFASLGHARHAAICGLVGNGTAAQRAIGHAHDALERADPGARRPVWITAFYHRSEVEALALSAHLSLGNYEEAEAHAHRHRALLHPDRHRNRAMNTARLAQAQLGQSDLDLALATVTSITTDAAHPRVAATLQSFGAKLRTLAPDSRYTRTWDDYARTITAADGTSAQSRAPGGASG